MKSRGLGFTIETPLITLEIVLEELESLHIHEEIIPGKMRELVEKMPSDGVFIHPIIVDSESLVVLDGMHRVAAAKEIGFHYIPVCLVDYTNPNIKIGCWYRMFFGLNDQSTAKEAINEVGFKPIESTYDEAYRVVENRQAVMALFSDTWCLYALGNATDIKSRYDSVKKMEKNLQERGHQMMYSTDKEAKSRVSLREYSAGLMTPTVTKREVVDTALAGKVFAQKTTRHIIPARPMNTKVPINWLNGDRSREEVNSLLRQHLTSRWIEKLSPGQILDRRYDEELYVFK